jgi:toxin ParE1/3/4
VRRLRVRYRLEAYADLEDIFQVVLHISSNQITAERFVSRIRARCRRIGHAPYGGRPRDDLEPGLRTVPFESSAVIAYKVEGGYVRITNIFYGGRDYEAFYLRGKRWEEDEES